MTLQAQGISVNKTVQTRQQGIAAGVMAHTVQAIASRKNPVARASQVALKGSLK